MSSDLPYFEALRNSKAESFQFDRSAVLWLRTHCVLRSVVDWWISARVSDELRFKLAPLSVKFPESETETLVFGFIDKWNPSWLSVNCTSQSSGTDEMSMSEKNHFTGKAGTRGCQPKSVMLNHMLESVGMRKNIRPALVSKSPTGELSRYSRCFLVFPWVNTKENRLFLLLFFRFYGSTCEF